MLTVVNFPIYSACKLLFLQLFYERKNNNNIAALLQLNEALIVLNRKFLGQISLLMMGFSSAKKKVILTRRSRQIWPIWLERSIIVNIIINIAKTVIIDHVRAAYKYHYFHLILFSFYM